jgi:hypothetical protein
MEYNKIAGAPISWGVCEVPGWGHQMAPARVLGEMAELGLVAPNLVHLASCQWSQPSEPHRLPL